MPIDPAFALLLVTSLAQATTPDVPPPPPPVLTASPALPAPPPPPPLAVEPRGPDLPRFGLAVDAGAPEGVNVSLTWRPLAAVRLWGGPSWNYVAFGAHAGATLIPLSWIVSPILCVEAGRYFASDLTWLATRAGGVPDELAPLLEKVSYDYASLQLGLELGSQRGLAFSIRAGLSWFSLVARGTARTTASGGTTGASDAQVELTDPRFTATMPSVKMGLQYWF
jgi:hypothetical protein